MITFYLKSNNLNIRFHTNTDKTLNQLLVKSSIFIIKSIVNLPKQVRNDEDYDSVCVIKLCS